MRSPETIFKFSAIAIAVLATTGCASQVAIQGGTMQEVPIAKAAESTNWQPNFSVRAGDAIEHAFTRLGQLNNTIYRVDAKNVQLTIPSAPISNEADLVEYLQAQDITVTLSGEGKYKKAILRKAGRSIASKTECNSQIFGTMPLSVAISEICSESKIECAMADAGATSFADTLYTMSYKGTCAGALNYIATKADLAISKEDGVVEFKMMDTASIDLGIPARDRQMMADIVANNFNSSAASGGSSGSSGGASGASGDPKSGGRSVRTSFFTNYLDSIKSLLSQSISPFGTYSYIPETGQLLVRDRRENVQVIREAASKLAGAFQQRYDVTLTFYRLTINRDKKVGMDINRTINEAFAFSVSGTLTGGAVPAAVMAFQKGNTTSTLSVLSKIGAVEALDDYSFSLQSNVPNTIKIGRNLDYVRNFSQTQAGTTGATTSSIEQATVTDGAFITLMARPGDNQQVNLEMHAHLNRFDGFDTTEAGAVTVRSPKSFERTFDATPLLTEGVPYAVVSVKQKGADGNITGVPGLEKLAGLVGVTENAKLESHIVAIVELRKK